MKKTILHSAIFLLGMFNLGILAAQEGTISGFVWLDVDPDGFFATDESGMMDIEVTLTSGTAGTLTTSTDSNGFYTFEDLNEGDYTAAVLEWPVGIAPSTQSSRDVTLIQATGLTGFADFGFMIAQTGECDLSITDITETAASCGTDNGSISVLFAGGVAPLITTVNGEVFPTGDQVFNVFNLEAGTYEIVITDFNDCQASVTGTVSQGGIPVYTVVSINATSCDASDATAQVMVNPGTGSGAFTIISDNGVVNGLTITGLAAGTYNAILEDAECGQYPMVISIECNDTGTGVVGGEGADTDGDDTGVVGGDDGADDDTGTVGGADGADDDTGVVGGDDGGVDGDDTGGDGGVGGGNQPPCSGEMFFCTPQLTSVEYCISDDCDPDGDDFMITDNTGSLFGCSIHIDTDKCFTYTPLPAFLGQDFLQVTICDSGNPQECSVWDFFFTVGPQCGPILSSDEFAIPADESSVLMVLDNDEHPLDLDFSITDATDGIQGTVVVDPSGQFVTYTPSPGFQGGDSFSYTVCDSDGICINEIVILTVGMSIVTIDTDGDGLSDIEEGVVDVDGDGQLDYDDPNIPDDDGDGVPNFNDPDSDNDGIGDAEDPDSNPNFGLCMAEAGNLSPNGESCISPSETYAAPTLTGDNTDDGFTTVFVLTTDFNSNDDIIYDVVSLNTTGAFDFDDIDDTNPGIYNVHSLNFEGSILDIVTLNPASGEEVLVLIENETICGDLNVPGISFEVSENCGEEICEDVEFYCAAPSVEQEICFDFCDLASPTVIDSLSSTYTGCSVHVVNDSCVTYIPVPAFAGLDSVIAYSCSPLGICDTSWAYINVGCQAPMAMNDTYQSQAGVPIFLDVTENDSEACANEFEVSLLEEPAAGVVVVSDDGFDYVVEEGYNGFDSFSYIVCSDCSETACDTAVVNVEVGNTPVGPIIVTVEPDIIDVPFNSSVPIDVLENDGAGLSVTELGDPLNGTVTLDDDGLITYTPNEDYSGSDYFEYVACNDEGGCETTFVQIQVLVEGEEPTLSASNDLIEVDPGSTTNIAVFENDVIPGGGVFIITEITDGGDCGTASISPDQMEIIFIADEDCMENVTITYTVCEDGTDVCEEAELLISVGVAPSNTPPVAVNDTVIVNDLEGHLENISENDFDNEGDGLFYSTASGPECAENFEMNDEGLTIYDAAEGCDEDLVMYIVCDDAAVSLCDTAFILFLIDTTSMDIDTSEVLMFINAVDDLADVDHNGQVEVNVFDNDTVEPEGEDFTITILEGPENGFAEVQNDGDGEVIILYAPNANFSGTDLIEYELCVDGECDTAFLTLEVKGPCGAEFPNGFSPNNDGTMDEFSVENVEDCFPGERQLIIYNRWGNEVYNKANFENSDSWNGTWEGEPVPDGTYFYIFIVKGESETEDIEKAGYLEVYR